MISSPSKFKLVERGFKDTIVLVPGWATDHRIFSTLELSYNYLLPLLVRPFCFREDLSEFLNKESIDKVSLFGWSSGGFLAADFAALNPQKVDALILVSIRRKFPLPGLKMVERYLEKNKKAYLYKFYLECFSKTEKEELAWFKNNLLGIYLEENEMESLLDGLDYLAQASIVPESLKSIRKIKIVHGLKDKIAPPKEALEIKEALEADFVSLFDAGHLPFLNQGFSKKFLCKNT